MAQWITFDTRQLGRDRSSLLDGFVHVVPKAAVSLHVVDIGCWCDPRLVWPENGQTLIVSHRDKKQKARP